MNKNQRRRLIGFSAIFMLFSLSIGLILFALKQNINLFYTPTELLTQTIKDNQLLRIGGYVQNKSVRFSQNGKMIHFSITDRKNTILINYSGVLPTLFREGQGVVVSGYFVHKQFRATEVLAKHDEKYMPKNIVLKRQQSTVDKLKNGT